MSEFTFEYKKDKEGTDRLEFKRDDNGNQATVSSKKEMDNYTELATFMGTDSTGKEKGIRFFYNAKGVSVYACEVDADGNLSTSLKVYDIFKDNVELEEGCKYNLRVDYSKVDLSSDDVNSKAAQNGYWNVNSNDYFDLSNAFQKDNGETDHEFLSSLKLKETPSESSDDTESETDEEDETVTEDESSIESQTSETAETNADSQPSDESQATVQTDASQASEQVISGYTTVIDVEKTDSSGNGGLIAGLVCVSIVAAAAIAGCVVLFRQMQQEKLEKDRTAKELDQQKRLHQTLTERHEDLCQAYQKREKALKKAENRVLTLENLTESQNEKQRKSQNTLTDYRAHEHELQQKIERLTNENRSLRRDNSLLSAEISSLRRAKAEAAAPETPVIQKPTIPVELVSEDRSLQLCILQSELNQHSDAVFVSVEASVSGAVHLNVAPYKRAQLAIIDQKAYLNPYYFQNLKDGRESYNNLMAVRKVFEMDGLTSASETYGLYSAVPAKVIEDASGSYLLQSVGSLKLKNN